MSEVSLVGVFKDVFAYVLWFKRNCTTAQPAYAEVKSKILSMLEATAWSIREHRIDPRDYDDARFAIVVWIDETMLSSAWIYRDEWRRSMLQLELYNSTRGGEEVFDRLNQLTTAQNPVREVYYFCLSLGLTGRFCHEGDDILLEQLMRASHRMLAGEALKPEAYSKRVVFKEAYDQKQEVAPKSGKAINKTGKWSSTKTLLVSVPPVVIGVVYLVYFVVLNGVSSDVVTRVAGG